MIAAFVPVVLGAFGTWWFWNWQVEHQAIKFLTTAEAGDLAEAYGV